MSEWDDGRKAMGERLLEILTEADAVITYNCDKYDLPKINGHLLMEGLDPPPPPASIDVVKTVKKMGFVMARLAYVGPALNVGKKMKHEGFQLWRDCMDGQPRAQNIMRKYNIQDVRVLVDLYKRVRPYISNHPHMGGSQMECPACNSTFLKPQGFRRTRMFQVQRLRCDNCGHWSTGKRTKVPVR